MKNKSIILSRTAIAFLLGALVFVGFAVYFFKLLPPQPVWAWISIGCSLFFLGAAACVPLFYVVDKKGIRIRYMTGDKEVYEWKNVRGIVAEYDSTIPYVFDTFYIDGDDYTFYMFYKEGRMERSGALARAIEKHSGKAVDGLIPEGVTGGAARRFKAGYGKTVEAGAAQAAEREARKLVRGAVAALGDGAKALAFDYAYATPDGEGSKRPNIDYSYLLVIRRGGERLAEVKLLTVKRRGKAFKVTESTDSALIESEIKKHI